MFEIFRQYISKISSKFLSNFFAIFLKSSFNCKILCISTSYYNFSKIFRNIFYTFLRNVSKLYPTSFSSFCKVVRQILQYFSQMTPKISSKYTHFAIFFEIARLFPFKLFDTFEKVLSIIFPESLRKISLFRKKFAIFSAISRQYFRKPCLFQTLKFFF